MKDPRIEKLAKLLINYSLNLKTGQKLLIKGSDLAAPLITECYREAVALGAHPEVEVSLPGLAEIMLKDGSDEQLKYISPRSHSIVDDYDAIITMWGEHNTRPLSNIDNTRISMQRGARKEWMAKFDKRVGEGTMSWVGTQYPTHSDAQEASMSLEEYEEFVYGAGLLDKDDPVAEWKKISNKQQKIADFLSTKKEVRYVSVDTDITIGVEGRKWINCDGSDNFPDGEVFTTPIKDKVNGKIRFSFPGIYAGKEVEDIRLEFKDGKVINASAAKGEDLLNSLLDTDEGSRFLGEVAIGTNYGITKFTKNILFDEKIGGTVHLAIGSGFSETGGTNESGVHWDMICDMRAEGKIYADGELIYEKGAFIIDL